MGQRAASLLSLIILVGYSSSARSEEYIVSLNPEITYTTLNAAEAAMQSVSVQASYLQFKEIIAESATETIRLYTVPDELPEIWWLANIGNTGPGPNGGTADPGGNCESCLQASGGFHWTGVLTQGNGYLGCQFTQRDGTIQNNGCIVYPSPSCRPGFTLARDEQGVRVCRIPLTATITVRSTCPIDDLPEITDPDVLAFENNPDRVDTERLTPRMQTALQCLQSAVRDAGSSSSIGSAYRPPAYNQHLIDVWNKWRYELMNEARPECQALKATIKAHFDRHSLLLSQTPVPNSRHTRGEAVDVTILGLTSAQIDGLAGRCSLRRPSPIRDPVHFQ